MSQSYIQFLQEEEPGIWASLQRAAEMGLVSIDEPADAVTATARLLLTYPDLHEVLNMLTDNWIRRKADQAGQSLIFGLAKGDKPA